VTIRNGKYTAGDNPGVDSSVENLVSALKSIGAKPQDIIGILQAMSQAGVLHAQIIVM